MKTNAIIRIILLSIAIIVLLTILVVGIAAGQFMFDPDSYFSNGDETVSSSGSVPAGEVRDISIDWAAGSITIRPADVDEITFTETLAEDQEAMVWKKSGDTLEIEFSPPNLVGFGNYSSKGLLIKVPRGWTCGTLEIDAASADLDVDSLTIGKVEFDGASGYGRFHNCDVEDLELDTASGNIQFIGTLNTLDCDAASADCDIALTNVPHRIEMEMASGDLDLTLPADCGFTARLDALSGEFFSDFTTTFSGGQYVHGDGAARIYVNSMSGNVTIRQGK